MAATGLYDAAVELLAACRAILETTTGGTPPRSYVSPGAPPDDCEMLTVTASGLGEEDTSPFSPAPQTGHRSITGRVNLVTFQIRIVRCIPTSADFGGVQLETILQASAKVVDEDGWSLWNGLMSMVRHEELWSTCREVHFDSAVAVPTLGNVGGWLITIRVALDGYAVTIGT